MSFQNLGLSDDTLKAIGDSGYSTPTPIQERAIPVVLERRDVLGCAQTGTGKTAGFTLPMMDILARGRARARLPRSLILEPTRELAAQVAGSFERYGKYHRLSTALLIGGESFTDQERALARGVDVLIATPGRLIDLFERGRIMLNDVNILVIDEADRMLDMGFIPDIERIVGLLPKARQTLFFSATMPPEIRKLADAFLTSPEEISVAPPASPAETVDQQLALVPSSAKRPVLRAVIDAEAVENGIVFCNRKRDVDILVRSLIKCGYDASALHGDMPQYRRTETLESFRTGRIRLLVASDVAARGLDIPRVSHVFNFDVPLHAEDYVHRIGRTGRAGRAGTAVTIATPEDAELTGRIEKLIGRSIPRRDVNGIGAGTEPEAEAGAGNGRRRHPAPASDGRGRTRAAPPAAERSRPSTAFGEHTPAFLLRGLPARQSA